MALSNGIRTHLSRYPRLHRVLRSGFNWLTECGNVYFLTERIIDRYTSIRARNPELKLEEPQLLLRVVRLLYMSCSAISDGNPALPRTRVLFHACFRVGISATIIGLLSIGGLHGNILLRSDRFLLAGAIMIATAAAHFYNFWIIGCHVLGQDSSWLTEQLREKGYEILVQCLSLASCLTSG
ncbi:hypothetical protein P153DRAFT_142397 [Dothidotthia symphoricarpi CBS 119687]|uniref:Uncharacterized protein n=1 Tax=Dothidotthia symphoricarpi CBS 119687 TaxID=1392245 RepID=A0A6A5ZYM5_9PLEO|nr:uncharacterized protein P153DRAFT_142397 [Dothidotthia symphoricarpi CBS 119687]KAF2124004.1 hypothetical protein P153DRAFT_142397 [Dothidotthia symphoricarpi CBS 119687]